MAQIINIQTITDKRGSLTVVDKVLPFDIKRVFYIYNTTSERGGHRNKKTKMGLICVAGSCNVQVSTLEDESSFILDKPDKCLLLEPDEWRKMDNFSEGAVVMALCSEHFSPDDYIEAKHDRV